MIGALLSNTPATLLRSSGVAGDLRHGSGEDTPDRERDSAASAQRAAGTETGRSGSVPVLTPQAVLALQESRELQADRSRTGAAAAQDGAPDEDGSAGGSVPVPEDGQQSGQVANPGGANQQTTASGTGQGQADADKKEDPDGDGLNEAEEKQVDELAQRDREVRAHEQAHARVGGAYASAPSYTFQQGPDGKRYAIGGEVQIDTARERTPEATIRKMQIVIRAATAPAEPSSQDLKVAQQARSQLSEAQAEVRQQKAEELNGGDEAEAGSPDASSAGTEAEVSGSALEPEGASEASGEADKGPAGAQSSDEGGNRRSGSEDAISAYQSALSRVDAAQSLFDALIA